MPKMDVIAIKAMAQANNYKGYDIDEFSNEVKILQDKTGINANWYLALFYAEGRLNPKIIGGFENKYKGLFQVGSAACDTINKFPGAGCNYATFQNLSGARQVQLYEYFLKGHGLLGKINNPADLHIGNVLPAVITDNFAMDRVINDKYKSASKQAEWMYPDGNKFALTRNKARAGFLQEFGVRFNLAGEMGADFVPNSTQQQQAQEQGVAQAIEEEKELIRYIDLNPLLIDIDQNLKSIEKGFINTTWGKKQTGEKYDWVGFKEYILYLAHRFMPGGIVPFFELIPNYQLTKSNLDQAQKDLRQNTDKIVDEVLQKYVGSFGSENVLEAKRKFQQVLEKIPGYNETRYNNQVAQFNKLSGKNDIFTIDPWKQEFDSLYKLNEEGQKSWKKKNVGLRVYGQLVLSPEANDNELTKAGEIGFEEIRINMGNGATKGLTLIELKLKDVQGNKFTDINSPWSFLFDARPGTASADFYFRYGWSIKVPPRDNTNPLSNLFWEHEGWKLFPDNVKNLFNQVCIQNNYYFLLTQSLNYNDYLWEKRNSEGNVTLGISGDEESSYMQLSLLNPKIEIDSSGCATATIQFRTGAGVTRNCPLNLAYTCQNMVKLYPNGVTLTDLIIAVDTDLKNNSTMVDEPGIATKKQEENISDSKARTNGSRDLTGIVRVIGARDSGDEDDQTINPDSILINFPGNLIQQIDLLGTDATLWSWFSELLTANECTLLNFMNGAGLSFTENYVITTTQENAEVKTTTNKKINPNSLRDVLIQDKDILAYKHDSSLIENISFQSNEKPNQFTIALNYRLGEWLNFNNAATTSTDNNDDSDKLHVLDRKTNIINMFSQMMEVNLDTICLPWICPGRKIHIRGTGFNDGNYSCLEVTHTIDSSNKFMSNIRGIRIIPPGDKDLETALSSPELFEANKTNSASQLQPFNNKTYPVNNNQTNQANLDKFNPIQQFKNDFLLKPSRGQISSKFGNRYHPKKKIIELHKGVDISCIIGTNVIAPADGVITLAQFSNTAGNWIHIQHDNGFKSVFMHLSKFNKKLGDRVNKGELIALSGNTGSSTGPHLHYEIYDLRGNPTDPEKYWA